MDIEDGIALEFNMNICERATNLKEEPCKLCIDSCPLDAIDFTY
jgi:ferredoxin